MIENGKSSAAVNYRLVELRAKNFCMLKAVMIRPSGAAVVRIAGRNEQGKSSALNAVAYALGDKRLTPREPLRRGQREGEVCVDFQGMKITRRFWLKEDDELGSSLTVEFADGRRPAKPQSVLDALRGSPIADDPLEFSRLKPREQYDLLKSLVPDFDFEANAGKRRDFFAERTAIGREYERAKGAAESIAVPPDARTEMVDVTALAADLRAVSDHNSTVLARKARREEAQQALDRLYDEIDLAKAKLATMEKEATALADKLANAEALPDLQDASEIEAKISNAEAINAGARKLHERTTKERERDTLSARYDDLTKAIESLDSDKAAAIAAVKLPVDGLSLGDGEILLDGLPFDQASTARKIRTATALLMALKPDLRVLLIREGSLLDEDARAALEADAAANDFVVLMEVVGDGGPDGITIEDGEVV